MHGFFGPAARNQHGLSFDDMEFNRSIHGRIDSKFRPKVDNFGILRVNRKTQRLFRNAGINATIHQVDLILRGNLKLRRGLNDNPGLIIKQNFSKPLIQYEGFPPGR